MRFRIPAAVSAVALTAGLAVPAAAAAFDPHDAEYELWSVDTTTPGVIKVEFTTPENGNYSFLTLQTNVEDGPFWKGFVRNDGQTQTRTIRSTGHIPIPRDEVFVVALSQAERERYRWAATQVIDIAEFDTGDQAVEPLDG